DFMDFSTFTEPIIKLLNSLNVPAKLEGRNDLLVDGKKFSGNAKLARNGKMIQHGTILFNSDMSVLGDALKINPLKYVDKAIKSNRARVINLIEYFPNEMTTDELKALLIDEMLETNEGATIYHLTIEDLNGIAKLIEEKYQTWDWNFGFSPKYNFKNAKKIPAGFIEVHLDVERGGIIEKAKIFGDFFASEPIEGLENKLIGVKHNEEEITKVLNSIDVTDYFGKVTVDEILEILN
ncbi:MAG TPA: lipoate--protein ligase, partial [Flavobacteriaceae bacterium]|nr:lipoate--protein ligase [Flavobacteriaceae bacterium]